MAFLPSLERNSVLLNVFKAFPATAAPLLDYHEVLLRGPSPLTTAERELIAAFVSSLNGCRYCAGVHTAVVEFMGVAEGTVARLKDDVTLAAAAPKLRPLLAYARKLTQSPAGITQADADAVFDAGWEEQALHDAVAVCCLFNFMNRYVEGLGIEADAKYFAMAAERLSKNGYKGLKDLIGLTQGAEAADGQAD